MHCSLCCKGKCTARSAVKVSGLLALTTVKVSALLALMTVKVSALLASGSDDCKCKGKWVKEYRNKISHRAHSVQCHNSISWGGGSPGTQVCFPLSEVKGLFTCTLNISKFLFILLQKDKCTVNVNSRIMICTLSIAPIDSRLQSFSPAAL